MSVGFFLLEYLAKSPPGHYHSFMKRRIFTAINLPAELKEKIAEAIKQWRWLPIRWLKPENWHITLTPPVYLEDTEVRLLCDLPPHLPDTAGRCGGLFKSKRFGKPFAIGFSCIVLAPPGAKARMIWLEGETPPELVKLKKKIETLWLAEPRLPRFETESRPFKLHVTLARFEPGDLKEIEEKTRVLGEVKLGFEVKEISVMESHLKPDGAEYETLAGFPLL